MALRCGDLLKLLADEDSPVFVFSNQMACKYGTTKNVSGLVVECWPAALKAEVQTPDEEPKNLQYRFSSAETLQPGDHKRYKARGCLVLSVLQKQVKDPGHP